MHMVHLKLISDLERYKTALFLKSQIETQLKRKRPLQTFETA